MFEEASSHMNEIEKVAKEIENAYWVRTGRYPDDTPHKVDLGAAVYYLMQKIKDLESKLDRT